MFRIIIRKMLCMALLFVMLISTLLAIQPGKVLGADPQFAGGSGTVQDPWIITTPTQLDAVRYNLSAYYKLGSDINLTYDTQNPSGQFYDAGAGWTPIGASEGAAFTGTFDGDGHRIIRLYINRPSTDYVGLFGYVGSGGTVRNIGLKDISVSGNGFVGGLVGCNTSAISNAYTTGDVSGNGNYVGGLVGQNFYGAISNAYATGNVSGNGYVGGLLGSNNLGTTSNAYATGSIIGRSFSVGGLTGANFGTISKSYSTGKVSSPDKYVGGLSGFNSGAINNAYATGSVNGGSYVGGLVGDNFLDGTITDSYWDINTTGHSSGVGASDSTFSATGLTTSNALMQSRYSDFNFSNDWFMIEGSTRPFLRSEWSNVITNAHQLQLMAMNLTSQYALANDIDLQSHFVNKADMWATDSNNGAGWAPIGSGTAFTGTFDGGGYRIVDLYINRPSTDYVGLFGNVGTGSIVRNIGLQGGSVSGNSYVGELIGYNNGTIKLAYANGSVNSNGNGSTIIGGLVGQNNREGNISNSYVTGVVSGNGFVGGLVGQNYSGSISNTYAAGSVSSNGYDPGAVGGLVGYNNGGSISNSFYDKDTTGQSALGKGTPQNTDDMKTISTFTAVGWDFSTVWGIHPFINNGYPVFVPPYFVTYDGNGATGGNVPTDIPVYTQNDKVTVYDIGDLVRTGYMFDGWNTSPNGAGSNYSPGDIFIMRSSNVTLYAMWKLNIYTASFDSQGGTSVNSQIVFHGDTISAPNAPTKTGFSFGGWYTDSALTTAFDFNSPITGDLTLYAKWTAPIDSTLSPATGSFDKNVPAQSDVTTTLTLNGNTLISINNGEAMLASEGDYTVSGNTVTIKKEYLAAQQIGAISLKFTFSAGAPQTLAIMISDTTPPASLIGISLSSGHLDFATNVTEYSLTVSQSTTALTVKPTLSAGNTNATIQIRINGGAYFTIASGMESPSLTLVSRVSNVIEVLFTAQNGATQLYTITVNQSASPVLSKLTMEGKQAKLTFSEPLLRTVTDATYYTISNVTRNVTLSVTEVVYTSGSAEMNLNVNGLLLPGDELQFFIQSGAVTSLTGDTNASINQMMFYGTPLEQMRQRLADLDTSHTGIHINVILAYLNSAFGQNDLNGDGVFNGEDVSIILSQIVPNFVQQ